MRILFQIHNLTTLGTVGPTIAPGMMRRNAVASENA